MQSFNQVSGMQNKVQAFLIAGTLILKTIPVLGSSWLPFAPINFLSLISFGYIIVHKDRFISTILNKKVFHALSFFLIYYAFQYVFKSFGYDLKPNLVLIVQNLIFFILIIQLDWNSIKFIIRVYLILLLSELFFSFAVYFIGEPFASIRTALIDNPDYFYIGEHERIAGFQRTIFLYAYPLAILPLLTLILFYTGNRFLSLILVVIAYLGILLNGERVSLILSSSGFIILFFITSRKGIQIIYFILFICLIIFLNSRLNTVAKSVHGLTRLNELSSEEMSQRMLKQWIGIETIMNSPFTPADMNKYNELSKQNFGTEVSTPHNQFINVGLNAGIFGWLIMGSFLLFMIGLYRKARKVIRLSRMTLQIQIWYVLNFAFWISIGVGFFHNAGIFDFENTQFTIFCFLFALHYQIIVRAKVSKVLLYPGFINPPFELNSQQLLQDNKISGILS